MSAYGNFNAIMIRYFHSIFGLSLKSEKRSIGCLHVLFGLTCRHLHTFSDIDQAGLLPISSLFYEVITTLVNPCQILPPTAARLHRYRQTENAYMYYVFVAFKTIQFSTVKVLVGFFRLFIVATGYPSEQRPPRGQLVVTADSARIQDETTESSAWFFNVLGVLHRYTGPRFKVSSERQLIIVRLISPGIEPTTSIFQVERSNQLS